MVNRWRGKEKEKQTLRKKIIEEQSSANDDSENSKPAKKGNTLLIGDSTEKEYPSYTFRKGRWPSGDGQIPFRCHHQRHKGLPET